MTSQLAYMWELVSGVMRDLLVPAFGTVYAALVVLALRAEGWRVRRRWDWQAAARSVDGALLWLGVIAAAAGVRVARVFFDLLVESSAEVGEWFLHRCGHAELPLRSRFS